MEYNQPYKCLILFPEKHYFSFLFHFSKIHDVQTLWQMLFTIINRIITEISAIRFSSHINSAFRQPLSHDFFMKSTTSVQERKLGKLLKRLKKGDILIAAELSRYGFSYNLLHLQALDGNTVAQEKTLFLCIL